jgi:hypothetical protein
MSQRPVARGLVICEKAIIEEGTRNVTLVSCFNRFRIRQFPSGPRSFAVYTVLTDGQGQLTLDLVVSRLDNGDEIYQQSRVLGFPVPLDEVRYLTRVNDCSFPVAGAYAVTLQADGEFIAQARIEVAP